MTELMVTVEPGAGIGQIAVVQHKVAPYFMRVFIDMIDAIGVKERGSPFDAVDFVTLRQ